MMWVRMGVRWRLRQRHECDTSITRNLNLWWSDRLNDCPVTKDRRPADSNTNSKWNCLNPYLRFQIRWSRTRVTVSDTVAWHLFFSRCLNCGRQKPIQTCIQLYWKRTSRIFRMEASVQKEQNALINYANLFKLLEGPVKPERQFDVVKKWLHLISTRNFVGFLFITIN